MRTSLRIRYLALGVALAVAAGAETGTASTASLPLGWDISNPAVIPANGTCGHTARYNYSSVSVDWAVDGVVVALDEVGINHTNDGSPYTLSVGQVSGGVFSASYSETFYPEPEGGELSRTCRSM